MLDFKCWRRHRDGTPIVRDDYIQDYGEDLLRDYNPSLLETPGKINAIHFLETYLGLTIEFQNIYYPEGSDPIAGATIFNHERIQVFDRDGMRCAVKEFEPGTVLIDNSVTEKPTFALFTLLHEGGHYCMHAPVYRKNPNQVSLFAPEGAHAVQCKRSMIEHRGKLVTQEDFREHQASTLAAALAMPRPTFVPMMRQYILDAGFSQGIWIIDPHGDWEDEMKLENMIKVVTDTYGVSFTAAKIQLQRQGLLMHEWQYEKLMMQGVS